MSVTKQGSFGGFLYADESTFFACLRVLYCFCQPHGGTI
jgi:hypothetical protein